MPGNWQIVTNTSNPLHSLNPAHWPCAVCVIMCKWHFERFLITRSTNYRKFYNNFNDRKVALARLRFLLSNNKFDGKKRFLYTPLRFMAQSLKRKTNPKAICERTSHQPIRSHSNKFSDNFYLTFFIFHSFFWWLLLLLLQCNKHTLFNIYFVYVD